MVSVGERTEFIQKRNVFVFVSDKIDALSTLYLI
jgi:hypothetical protein